MVTVENTAKMGFTLNLVQTPAIWASPLLRILSQDQFCLSFDRKAIKKNAVNF